VVFVCLSWGRGYIGRVGFMVYEGEEEIRVRTIHTRRQAGWF
jgi:hypothetical protein